MLRKHCVCLAFCASLLLVPAARAVVIETVPVGDPGNDVDYVNAYLPFGFHGAVAYEYRIGTYEVTNDQYAAFLNAKAVSDSLALYNPQMESSIHGGITRSGSPGSYSYQVKPNMGNKPVNLVSWYDAVRFVNWLSNGQGPGDTESGSYTLEGGTPIPTNGTDNGANIVRNPGATWVLPSIDEWYKAAFFDPRSHAEGGPFGNYWLYATMSDRQPSVAVADSNGDITNPGPNIVNWDPASSGPGTVTTVGGAGPLSTSYYGTYDQNGNVYEWVEQSIEITTDGSTTSDKMIGGGSYADVFSSSLWPASFFPVAPDYESEYEGFRIALVPEPSSLILVALGALGCWCAGRRGLSHRAIAGRRYRATQHGR